MPKLERVDIGDLLSDLCGRFGLDKNNCSAIHIFPDRIRFDMFLTNKEGNYFVTEDGQVAETRIEGDIRT